MQAIKRPANISIDPELHEIGKVLARKEYMNFSQYMTHLLVQALQENTNADNNRDNATVGGNSNDDGGSTGTDIRDHSA